jgi:hypothetical protein
VTTPGPRTRDDAAPEGEADAAGEATSLKSWGIGLGPWAWATRVRILFVIDGRITIGRGSDEFGLGLVLDTLRDPSFAWWPCPRAPRTSQPYATCYRISSIKT